MNRPLFARLAGMMFLFYFALASWSVTMPTYLLASPAAGGLGLSPGQQSWVSSAFALAGLVAPLFIGLLTERWFRAERVLAASSLGCAAFLLVAANWCERRAAFARDLPADELAGAAEATFAVLFAVMLCYQFCLQLGLTLTTVIALKNLADPDRQFSRARLFGTLGWIAAGNAVGLAFDVPRAQPLYLAAAASALLGLFALTLPRTPPAPRGKSLAESFGLPAWKLLANRSFAVFVFVTFLGVAMNQFYGLYAHRFLIDQGLKHPERQLTLGQVCEVGCLFLVPLLNPKRTMKWLMAIGLGGWVVRALALEYGSVNLVLALGVPMHGWSFAFFQVVGMTYLDRQAPPHLRASAQGMLAFVTGGLGNLGGNLLAGRVVGLHHRPDGAIEWGPVWLVPLGGCAFALALFVALFRRPRETPVPPNPRAVEA